MFSGNVDTRRLTQMFTVQKMKKKKATESRKNQYISAESQRGMPMADPQVWPGGCTAGDLATKQRAERGYHPNAGGLVSLFLQAYEG